MDLTHAAKVLIENLDEKERSSLKNASKELSLRYRNGSYQDKPYNKLERFAYLMARMPATYAACSEVFLELKKHLCGKNPSSFADIGSGPATASWAALEIWPSLKKFQYIEQDKEWIALSQRLAQDNPVLSAGHWLKENLMSEVSLEPSDLIVAAYAFQELPVERLKTLSEELFLKAKKALVIIEPGTPNGFARLNKIRTWLLLKSAHIVAPCSHQFSCPMKGSDWCHFSTRLKRDNIHRHLKDASLAYEDEKYAYLIATHDIVASDTSRARIIRAPIKRSGHIILDLCTEAGLKREIIPRSHAQFGEAKKLSWGSSICAQNNAQHP